MDAQVGIKPRSKFSQFADQGFIWLTKIFAFGVAALLIGIAIQVGRDAWPAISKFGLGFLASTDWDPTRDNYGALPQIFGTLASSFLALLIAVPVGVGVAIFLSEEFDFFPEKLQGVLVFLVELLAAIPSVVYGLWGIFVLMPMLRVVGVTGPSLLPASMVLAIMILPTITAISREALISLPKDMRQAAMGLGATRWETIIKVILPAAFSGIVGAVMLGLGRAMGETMAVTMLIGNSNRISLSLTAPANTIASLLANQFAEASGIQISALMYTAVILFILTLLVNILAEIMIFNVQKIK